MLGEISTALGGINAAVQIAKAMVGVQQDVTVKLEISKMLDAVLEAKTGLLAASETIGNLQEELRQARLQLAAAEDLSRYEYRLLETGANVVAIKVGAEKSEAERNMTFCPTCFDGRTLRLLQTENDDSYLRCFGCRNVYVRDFRQDQAIARDVGSSHGY